MQYWSYEKKCTHKRTFALHKQCKRGTCKVADEGTRYEDEKYVKSACGIAYLGVLKAIDTCFLSKGLTKKELPKKVEEYQKALQKYASPYNGKLLRQFNDIYDELHLAGYYRGQLHSVAAVKAHFPQLKTLSRSC